MIPLPDFIKKSFPYKKIKEVRNLLHQNKLDKIADHIFHHALIPVPASSNKKVSIHLLTNCRDWRMAAWSAATFLSHLQEPLPLVIHDDGSLEGWQAEKLEILFPGIRIIWRKDADQIALDRLAGKPQCQEFRTNYNNSIKLFDPWLVAEAQDIFSLDSDLLFFRKPDALIEWIDSERKLNLWNKDVQSAYTIHADEIEKSLGVKMLSNINSGLGAVAKASMDWDFTERYLSHPDARSHHWRIEQTGFAILSCKYGMQLLNEKYLIDINPNLGIPENISVRHYVGAVRTQIYTEGMSFLIDNGFLDKH